MQRGRSPTGRQCRGYRGGVACCDCVLGAWGGGAGMRLGTNMFVGGTPNPFAGRRGEMVYLSAKVIPGLSLALDAGEMVYSCSAFMMYR